MKRRRLALLSAVLVLGCGATTPDGLSQFLIMRACATERELDLPPGIAVAAIRTERRRNYSMSDYLQDRYLEWILTEHRDAGWWEEWASGNERVAARNLAIKVRTGRWPVSVIRSSYIMSFGPAQITPRTALSACRRLPIVPDCRGTVRELVVRILGTKAPGSIAATIIAFERNRFCEGREKCELSIAELLTLYSVGADIVLGRLGKIIPGQFAADGARYGFVTAAALECESLAK